MAQFVLAESARYWWPVTVRVPDEKRPGELVQQKLRVQFQPTSRDEALRAVEERASITAARDLIEHDRSQIETVVTDWSGVVDPDGNDVPFSRDALRMAIDQSWFRTAIERAYAESLYGEAGRLGN